MTVAKQRYVPKNAPMGQRRPLRVVCIGAGYSGLLMAIIAEHKMKGHNVQFQIYDMNEDLGGTWLVNRYPGCSCDVPAHNYAYSFAPNPAWPKYYATSEEIHAYMKEVSANHNCDQYFTYRHRVTKAIWDDVAGKWTLNVCDMDKELEFIDTCDVLINASGVLNDWKWPATPGLEKFKGKLVHSAHWDQRYSFSGKNAAIIGIGSSGIQILPEVAKVANSVTCFVRSETWILPRTISEPEEGDPVVDGDCNYVPKELQRFEQDPEYLLKHRKKLADRRIIEFKFSMADKKAKEASNEIFRQSMKDRLGSSKKAKEIASWLIPKFSVGCRRLTPGPGFLEALIKDNVTSIWDNIGSVDETGIWTKDGRHIDLDVICCATGFNTSFQPRFPIIGKNCLNLSETWTKNDPECYFGTTIPGFPNYFSFIGPNSPISNGSLVQAIQVTGVYIYKCIEKLQTEGIKSMEVSQLAATDYNEHSQAFLNETVWAENCSSWYKRGTRDGRIVAIYAGSAFHFVESLRKPRWEDYNYQYLDGKDSNRFRYLGNGFTRREARGGSLADTQTLDFDSYWDLMELRPIYD